MIVEALLGLAALSSATARAAVSVTAVAPEVVTAKLDLARPGPEISPLIFGVNFATDAHREQARVPLERWGGNRWTRFDWKTGNDAAGNDWFFVNGGQNASRPEEAWYNAALERNRKLGIATLVTVPTIGWVAKDSSSHSFSVAKYGPQKRTDRWNADRGNGIRASDGQPVRGNDPADAGKKIGPEYIGEFVRYLKSRFGPAGDEPRIHFALDNEPGLWHSTHRDVHPEEVTWEEVWDFTVRYATAVKTADPTAWVWGPTSWGWLGMKHLGRKAEEQPVDFFLRWYLRKLAAHERETGVRLVDVLDIHNYPEIYVEGYGRVTEGGRKAPSEEARRAAERARIDGVRTWWDREHVPKGPGVSTWIGEPMYLLGRCQDLIRDEYPGTRLAVTEWAFGGNDEMNGAIVHALVFQALMREGAYAATEWGRPEERQPAFHAFRMFRNYDGKGGEFRGRYIPGSSSAEDIRVFGARDDETGVLRVAVVNVDPARARRVRLEIGRGKNARTFVLDGESPLRIRNGGRLDGREGAVEFESPASSITVLEAGAG